MSYESIRSGAVVVYPYLWNREAARGETEGRKHRPTAVAVRVTRPGAPDLVLLFPISTKQPGVGQLAAEVPEIEKRRAGLDVHLRQWLILDECNEETIPSTHCLELDPPLGALSRRFFLPLLLEFIKRRDKVRIVVRRD